MIPIFIKTQQLIQSEQLPALMGEMKNIAAINGIPNDDLTIKGNIISMVDALYYANKLIDAGMSPADTLRLSKSRLNLIPGFSFDKDIHSKYYTLTYENFGTVASGSSLRFKDMKYTITSATDNFTRNKKHPALLNKKFKLAISQKIDYGSELKIYMLDENENVDARLATSPLLEVEVADNNACVLKTKNISFLTSMKPLNKDHVYYVDNIKVTRVSLNDMDEIDR